MPHIRERVSWIVERHAKEGNSNRAIQEILVLINCAFRDGFEEGERNGKFEDTFVEEALQRYFEGN